MPVKLGQRSRYMKVVKRILQKPILNLHHNHNCMQAFSLPFGPITITKSVKLFWKPSYLSQHPSVVCLPVQGQIFTQDPKSVLFKDGRDVHRALHCRDGLVEDAVHKEHPLFWGRTWKKETQGSQKRWKRWKRTRCKASVGGRPGIKCDRVIRVNNIPVHGLL